MPPDPEARLRRGEPVRVLFDANVLEAQLGERTDHRVVRITPEGAFRVEIADPAGGWRQTLPLAGFPSREQAERVAGLRSEE